MGEVSPDGVKNTINVILGSNSKKMFDTKCRFVLVGGGEKLLNFLPVPAQVLSQLSIWDCQ